MSENGLIMKVSQYLIRIEWPEDIVLIFDNKYIRNTVFKDKNEGLEWYVVIVSPAEEAFDHISPRTTLFNAIVVLTALCTSFIIVCSLVLYKCRNFRTLKMMQLDMIAVMLFGAIVIEGFCLSSLGGNNRLSCSVRPYLLSLGTSLYFSPMLAKTLYLYFRFQVEGTSRKSENTLSHFPKYAIVVSCVIISLVITTIWLFSTTDGTRSVTVYDYNNDGNKVALQLCKYASRSNGSFSQIGFLLALSLIGIYYAYQNRNLPETLVGGRVIIGAFLSVIVVAIITTIATSFIKDRKFLILAQLCGMEAAVLVGLGLLFLPTFIETLYVGDKQAADSVLRGMTIVL
jgi:hypothetical protein